MNFFIALESYHQNLFDIHWLNPQENFLHQFIDKLLLVKCNLPFLNS